MTAIQAALKVSACCWVLRKLSYFTSREREGFYALFLENVKSQNEAKEGTSKARLKFFKKKKRWVGCIRVEEVAAAKEIDTKSKQVFRNPKDKYENLSWTTKTADRHLLISPTKRILVHSKCCYFCICFEFWQWQCSLFGVESSPRARIASNLFIVKWQFVAQIAINKKTSLRQFADM